jgi:hypothetical protein
MEGVKPCIQFARGEGAREIEAAVAKRVSKAGDHLAAKEFPQDQDREEETRASMDPPGAVRRQAAHRHDAVDVGMVLQPLAPRVEHHQSANRAAQALGISRDLEQGLGGCLKQQVVHHAFVDEREPSERLRHREDEVDVADR